MNDEQLNELFAAARQKKTDTTRAEFGFETRLMANLTADEPALLWSGWLRRLVPVFAAVVVALGMWNYLGFRAESHDLNAAITGGSDVQWMLASLGGE
jgi:hypothetical protein